VTVADLSHRRPWIVLQVMTHTPHTSTTATLRDDARTPQPTDSTFGEMLEELIDLSAGFGVALLPVLLLAVPGIILFVVLPAILLLALAAPLAVIGAVIAVPPYLVARWLRRRRRRTQAAFPAREGGFRYSGGLRSG
jgi:Flp pilus assembly protein TadB